MKTSLTLLAGLLLATGAFAAGVPEPETVFYGRIINRSSGQVYQLTNGTLSWTVRRQNGATLTLTSPLRALKGGEFSYRLNVPHQALGLGMSVSNDVIPLTAQPAACSLLDVRVDGTAAKLIAPGSAMFEISQALRASTYRLDLEVSSPLDDSDGDGLPDWWAERFGISNPSGDADGDGRSNRSEFEEGSDPNHDDRVPSIGTKEIRAYADGTTTVLLHGIDSDSAAGNLLYTLTRVPEIGTLKLRNTTANPANPDTSLAAGSTFTQADLNGGRLILSHDPASLASQANFEVTLRDENPDHATATGTVAILFYRPSAATLALTPTTLPTALSYDQQRMLANYLLSKDSGHVIVDGSLEARRLVFSVPSSGLSATQYQAQYVPSYGRDHSHVLQGGTGADTLSGSMENDVLIGSHGDDTLRGNGGSDLFLMTGPADGNDTIADFSMAEGDALDLARMFEGSSPWLTNFLQITSTPSNSLLRIRSDGNPASPESAVVTMSGVQWSQSGLVDLVESGRLLTGTKVLAPRVTILASAAIASENGPVAGEFTVTRTGSAAGSLTVNLQITGSAQNGSDYAWVPAQVTFLPGERTFKVEITPYVDALTELSEVVQIAIVAGMDYELGASSVATVTIEDLAPQISIEALEAVAIKSDLTPGVLLVSRGGVLDRSVLVRLNIAGTATRNVDYDGVPNFINLQPWQTTALINVNPKSGAVLSNGVEFVDVAIRTDATYRLASPTNARVFLVNEQFTLPTWRDRFFPGSAGDLTSFASADPGLTGIRNLQRYAFGLDPIAPQTSPGRPLFVMRDGRLTVSYRRPVSVIDVGYEVEISDDLVTWHSGDAYVERVSAPEFANQPEMTSYRIKRTISEDRTMFMRVRVTYQP